MSAELSQPEQDRAERSPGKVTDSVLLVQGGDAAELLETVD